MATRMTTRALRLVPSLCITVCALGTVVSAGQPQPSAAQGGSYASLAKLPDWSGVWVIPFDAFAQEGARERQPGSTTGPQLTPEQAAKRAASQRLLSVERGGTATRMSLVRCGAPGGMPSVMRFAFGVEFLFTPGRVTLLLEQGPTIRRIFTDGRTHSSDPDPTYAGESIGHWENDTLVVDTIGITDTAVLTAGVYTSGHAHIVERMRLTDRTHLRIDTVVEDPIVLQTPWRYSRIYERSDGSWFERYCDNNRDGNDNEPDLTPPAR